MSKTQKALTCLLCELAIKRLDPVRTVYVFVGGRDELSGTSGAPPGFALAVTHYSCEIDTIAGEVAAMVLESMQTEDVPVRLADRDGREGGDLRSVLSSLAGALVDKLRRAGVVADDERE